MKKDEKETITDTLHEISFDVKREIHWTDEGFIKLAQAGYKYGYLVHVPNYVDYSRDRKVVFMGFNNYEEIERYEREREKNSLFGTFWPNKLVFKAMSAQENHSPGCAPHHLYMAYVFPKKIEEKGYEWWVLGHVVELWRYDLQKIADIYQIKI